MENILISEVYNEVLKNPGDGAPLIFTVPSRQRAVLFTKIPKHNSILHAKCFNILYLPRTKPSLDIGLDFFCQLIISSKN